VVQMPLDYIAQALEASEGEAREVLEKARAATGTPAPEESAGPVEEEAPAEAGAEPTAEEGRAEGSGGGEESA
ncbi:MAG: hypothetical protein GWO24_24320, partial [Akkermansiaceae bacterium]|nr:hypothetical protein [Akkermansiaceae bacterium]